MKEKIVMENMKRDDKLFQKFSFHSEYPVSYFAREKNGTLVDDDTGLCADFWRMNISGNEGNAGECSLRGRGGSVPLGIGRHGPYEEGWQWPSGVGPMSLNNDVRLTFPGLYGNRDFGESVGSVCSVPSYQQDQMNFLEQRIVPGCSSTKQEVQPCSPSFMRPFFDDAAILPLLNRMDSSGGIDVMSYVDHSHPHMVQSKSSVKGHKKSSRSKNRGDNVREKAAHPCNADGNGENLSRWRTLFSQTDLCSLDELKGYIYFFAKDQSGCRFLQSMVEEQTGENVNVIFNEVIFHIGELMVNPFGNYLVQKLLDLCTEEQKMKILLKVTEAPGLLVRISLNSHGTRVVQKMIQTVSTRRQIALLLSALEPGFLNLAMDLNGNHVLQSCLQQFSNEDNKFIFDAATKFCVAIATHQHGCCVLQRCIAHAAGVYREKLVHEISMNGLLLAQDPFGNYVIQYIIELKIPSAAAILNSQFQGNYVNLSVQKFSSHVVEKCIKYYEDCRPIIVHELLSVPHFDQLMQDPYANYVIRRALSVTKGHLHASLVQAVKPHEILRTSPYCKRLFSSLRHPLK